MTYGTANIDAIATSSGQILGAGDSTAFKNRIINGAMVIDQRNVGASVTPVNAQYTLDRWDSQLTQASKYSVQQNAGSVTPPSGFTNYLGVTSLSSYTITSSDIFNIFQNIEGYNIADLGWGTVNAKTVTLSFWAYSSLTGTFGGSIQNNGVDRSYPFSYSIPVANTWTYITITIPGDTTGTWLTNNSVGMRVWFSLGVISAYSGTAGAWTSGDKRSATGAISVVGTSGATFYITGVQLEVGSQATSFDFRDYGRELYLCQRYCQVYGRTAYACIMVAQCYSTTQAYSGYQFVTPMRSAPTLSYSALSDWVLYTSSGSGRTLTSSSISYATTQNGEFLFAIGSADLVAGNATVFATQNTNATLTLSAEL
jgi:hypothetical protein